MPSDPLPPRSAAQTATSRAVVPRGVVYLVGAGPGDPGLLTLRGAQCLARADVVLYDYLVNPQVLEHASAGTELVCLGRHGKGRIMDQAEVNRRMVEAAQAGRTVVRLKGGDPAVFAHSAEETDSLRAAGIAFEMVPGITAALAASSYAGFTLTHRDLASAVALVTGHEQDGKNVPAIDYAALARFPGTLVFYMGVTTADVWTRELIAAGMPPDTPAALVRRCSWPDQTTVRCTLRNLASELSARHIRPPVIAIVGAVAGLAPNVDWFAARPLAGERVLITRPEHQSRALGERLRELGADLCVQPAITISPPSDWSAVDAELARLAEYQWIAFSSANGVHYFCDRLFGSGRDARALGGVRLAAIGPGTADELLPYGLRADLVPAEFRAEALAAELAAVAQGRVLLVRASRGREVLAEQLREAGLEVEQIVAYESRDVTAADPQIVQHMKTGEIDWVTITSSAIARALVGLFGEDLGRARLASISPVTSATLRELGFEPAVEATEYTPEGVVQAILVAAAREV